MKILLLLLLLTSCTVKINDAKVTTISIDSEDRIVNNAEAEKQEMTENGYVIEKTEVTQIVHTNSVCVKNRTLFKDTTMIDTYLTVYFVQKEQRDNAIIWHSENRNYLIARHCAYNQDN